MIKWYLKRTNLWIVSLHSYWCTSKGIKVSLTERGWQSCWYFTPLHASEIVSWQVGAEIFPQRCRQPLKWDDETLEKSASVISTTHNTSAWGFSGAVSGTRASSVPLHESVRGAYQRAASRRLRDCDRSRWQMYNCALLIKNINIPWLQICEW